MRGDGHDSDIKEHEFIQWPVKKFLFRQTFYTLPAAGMVSSGRECDWCTNRNPDTAPVTPTVLPDNTLWKYNTISWFWVKLVADFFNLLMYCK